MFREILGVTLKDDVPRLGKALDEAKASGDPNALEQAAHAIKGLAAELRAEPCRIAAARLEKSRNAIDAAAVRAEFQELEEALKKATRVGS
jgi:HPt (histidine-containing phosphotransfer) domain-containing protein